MAGEIPAIFYIEYKNFLIICELTFQEQSFQLHCSHKHMKKLYGGKVNDRKRFFEF